MALIDWDDTYSVNVAEIDRQHKRLVAMINELHVAMRDRKTKDVLGQIISRLFLYTTTHFSTEEKYFDQFNYPEKTVHVKEHELFIQKINEFKQSFDEDRLMLSVAVIDFLKDWLLKHILGTDKKYSSFLNKKGVS